MIAKESHAFYIAARPYLRFTISHGDLDDDTVLHSPSHAQSLLVTLCKFTAQLFQFSHRRVQLLLHLCVFTWPTKIMSSRSWHLTAHVIPALSQVRTTPASLVYDRVVSGSWHLAAGI